MSASWTTELIRQIHDAPGQLVVCVTGGGSGAISALLEVPGASRTVLEATVPYASAALANWLQATPEQFCSESTARLMAMAAYRRALKYGGDRNRSIAGIACTASLASDRPKHGAHRIHAALQTRATTLSHCVELIKGHRGRAEEEAIAAAIVLNLVAEFKSLSGRADLGLEPAENLVVDRCDAPLDWQRLLNSEKKIVAGNAAAASHLSSATSSRLVFPGAFHPRHQGHATMARFAGDRLGLPVEHELSIVNVDKPPIDFIEMRKRASQFGLDEPLWLTRAATFVEKAALFPRATFIVGADTIVRIADAKYYASESARDDALIALAATQSRFLVFGRCDGDGFHSLRDVRLPEALNKLCDEVPAEHFRLDISSTALRASRNP